MAKRRRTRKTKSCTCTKWSKNGTRRCVTRKPKGCTPRRRK